MSEIASAFVSILPSARGFGSKLDSQVGGELKSSGSKLGKVFGAAVVGGALAGGVLVGKFVKDAAVLDTKMREVVTLFGETGAAADKSLGVVQGQVKDLSNEFGIAQTTLTGGLYQAISAGVPRENAFTFMQVASKASIAGVTDVETAVDGLTTTINAFGLDAKDAQAVSDSMFAAVKGGKTTFEELSGSLFNVAPAAAAAGVKFTEINAAIATLTAGGTPTSVATTQIRAALDGLQKPSEALTGIFQKLGFENAQVAIESKGLGFALDAVKAASKGNNGELQKLLGSSEAVAAANVLAGTGAKKFADELKNQANAANATNDAFDVVNKGFQRQFEILKTNLYNAGLSIGQALLPPLTAVMVFLNTQVGPGFQRVKAAILPVFEQIKTAISGVFTSGPGGGFLASLQSIATTIQANFLPVLQTMATTFTGAILPAVLALGTYLASRLFPVFTQIAGIISGQVIPIIASFATFLYGTLWPALIQIATAVAQRLRPIFDQLVATFQSSVLPTVEKLLVKFREWQPTIQIVVAAVVKIIGKVLEFAAAILGKVLPPVIRFAGFLIANVVPAVAAAIGIIIKIIAQVIEFGQTVVEAVKFIARFVSGLKDQFGEALAYVRTIPGKIKDGLGAVGSLLLEAGKDVIRGLINGIKSMASSAADAAKSVVKGAIDGAKSLLKIGSPSKVFEEIGMWSMAGFAKGIEDHGPKVLDKLKVLRDGIKSNLDGIRSDFDSLSSSIASAFTGNLFEATTGADFVSNLLDTKGQLKGLSAAFKKLVKWGVPAKFLSQLFASGNAALILDLADGSKSTAFDAFQLFNQVDSLSNQLGGDVASNRYGEKLDRANRRLERIEKAIKLIGRDVGRELNAAAAHGQRSA